MTSVFVLAGSVGASAETLESALARAYGNNPTERAAGQCPRDRRKRLPRQVRYRPAGQRLGGCRAAAYHGVRASRTGGLATCRNEYVTPVAVWP